MWYESTKDVYHVHDRREDLDTLYDWIKDPKGEEIPPIRVHLEDDPIIIAIANGKSPDTGLAIVTDDVRLCRDVYNTTKLWVVRIPVKWYYLSVYYGDGDDPWLETCQSRFPMLKWETIQDTGSIESYEEIGFRDGLPIDRPVERKFRMLRPSHRGLRRSREPAEKAGEVLADWKPYGFPEDYLFSSHHFLLRRKHPYRRGMA